LELIERHIGLEEEHVFGSFFKPNFPSTRLVLDFEMNQGFKLSIFLIMGLIEPLMWF
jgi:hypothetical protein